MVSLWAKLRRTSHQSHAASECSVDSETTALCCAQLQGLCETFRLARGKFQVWISVWKAAIHQTKQRNYTCFPPRSNQTTQSKRTNWDKRWNSVCFSGKRLKCGPAGKLVLHNTESKHNVELALCRLWSNHHNSMKRLATWRRCMAEPPTLQKMTENLWQELLVQKLIKPRESSLHEESTASAQTSIWNLNWKLRDCALPKCNSAVTFRRTVSTNLLMHCNGTYGIVKEIVRKGPWLLGSSSTNFPEKGKCHLS